MEKINKTKKKILDVAEKLFSEKGYDAVSVDNITKTAGIAKGLFFYYFENKQDILYTLMKVKRELAIQSFMEDKNINKEELTKEYVYSACRKFILENQDIFRIALFECLKTNDGTNIILELPKEIFEKLEGIVEFSKEEKIRLIITVIKTTMFFSLSNILCENFNVSEEELRRICKEESV